MALRFRPPAPALAWEGVREATSLPSACPQNPPGGKFEGSEDCLYLNVFTRHLNPEAKRPVIVFIHGGAFTYGSVNTATGQYMLEQDMVLVTLHYRLGPLGFLTTEDSAAPGNIGLHDQVAALRWVQTHIGQFGGDPALVTLVGMSDGGASVNYLQLSPQTDGLFQRAAALSGWANIPNQAKTAKALAEALACPTSPSSALLDCLRGKHLPLASRHRREGANDNLVSKGGPRSRVFGHLANLASPCHGSRSDPASATAHRCGRNRRCLEGREPSHPGRRHGRVHKQVQGHWTSGSWTH